MCSKTAPGHTPGSSAVVLTSGGDKALFAGDLMHTPLQLMYPEFGSCFCVDLAAARSTRRDLLGWASDNTALALPAHFSGHGALEVARDGGAFAIKGWAPLPAYSL
jgi:glyoxylase-like metal-dependent hydrolase (beta-lactamase superfamily II)